MQSSVLTCDLGISCRQTSSCPLVRKARAKCLTRPRSSLELLRNKSIERALGLSSKETCDIDMDCHHSKARLEDLPKEQQISALKLENQRLLDIIRDLELENATLRGGQAELDTSVSSCGSEDYPVVSLALSSSSNLQEEVQRHRAFITHMKRQLQLLLLQREAEHRELQQTKRELADLLKTTAPISSCK